MKRLSIRLVAIDMDDTLLTDELEIAPGTAQAIAKAQAAGVDVVLATGRMFASAQPYARQLGLKGPHIVYNGALVKMTDGQEVLHRPIHRDLALDVLDFALADGWIFQCYVDDRLYVPEITSEVIYYTEVAGVPAQKVDGMREFVARSEPTKMLAIGSPKETEERAERLRHHFGERLSVTISKPYFVEVLQAGVTKASALAEVARRLGIAREEVLAIGDSFNDAEMLQWAGVGVAMGNAHPDVQQLADYVVASNMEEGVAEAFARFVFV